MTAEQQESRREDDPAEQARTVLRGIWSARGQSGAELEERFGTGQAKVCKNMKDIGFGGMAPDAVTSGPEGTNTPVDTDVRSAWRRRLEREGKLHPGAVSIREMVLGTDTEQ